MKYLTDFEQGALYFHFVPGSTNYVTSFAYHSLRKSIMAEVWGEIHWIWFGSKGERLTGVVWDGWVMASVRVVRLLEVGGKICEFLVGQENVGPLSCCNRNMGITTPLSPGSAFSSFGKPHRHITKHVYGGRARQLRHK